LVEYREFYDKVCCQWTAMMVLMRVRQVIIIKVVMKIKETVTQMVN